jgi:hypothetical protein
MLWVDPFFTPLGEGPAYFFPTEQLPQLGKPTVWNYWPLFK